MIQTSFLTSLVSALRAETAINSITPETLGSVLQRIVYAMGNGLTSEDLTGIGGGSGGAFSAEMAKCITLRFALQGTMRRRNSALKRLSNRRNLP